MSFYIINPDLKNPKALERFKDGRKARLNAELHNNENNRLPIPLFSHNTTWQSQFCRGWQSIQAIDIAKQRHRYKTHLTHRENQDAAPLHPRIQDILRRTSQHKQGAHRVN